jgi:hypothetical protein
MKAEILEYARPASGTSDSDRLFGFRRELSESIAVILNTFWQQIPQTGDFRHSVLSLLKKKMPPGRAFDPSDPKNYRGIACGNTMANLLQVILATRLQHWLLAEEVTLPEQGGFSPQQGCEQLVLTLMETIRMKTHEGRYVATLYLDISNAYDDVHLDLLFAILRHAGAGEHFCRTLRDWFKNRTISVKGSSVRYPCDKGLPQGSPIAPALWNVMFDTLLRRLKERVPGVRIERRPRKSGGAPVLFLLKMLAYADDLVIIVEGIAVAEVRQKLQAAVCVIASWAIEFSFRINTGKGKTEAMVFPPYGKLPTGYKSLDAASIPPLTMMNLDGAQEAVQFVASYKYLGVPMTWDLDISGFRSTVLGRLASSIRRHFSYDPVTRALPWAAQTQIYNSLCLGQINFMLGVVRPDSGFKKGLDQLFREGTRIRFKLPGKMSNFLVDMEASGSPSDALILMHQTRALRSLRYFYRKDAPILGLVAVQEHEDNRKRYYRPYVEGEIEAATRARPVRGDTRDRMITRGILKDAVTAKASKVSARTLRITLARTIMMEGKSGSNRASTRAAQDGAEACRRLRGTTATSSSKEMTLQEEFGRALYCVGVGTSTADCELHEGTYRLSMPGPGVPTLLSAVTCKTPMGALPMSLRMHRPSYMTAPFRPRAPTNWRLKKGVHITFNMAGERPCARNQPARMTAPSTSCCCANTRPLNNWVRA